MAEARTAGHDRGVSATAAAEKTSRHLEHAYERDLPITLTRYADPELLGRIPARHFDILPLLYAQQKANRLQRQQEKSDYGEVAEDTSFPLDDPPPGVEEGDDRKGGKSKKGSFIGKRNVLPDAMWDLLSEAAGTHKLTEMHVKTTEIAALAAGFDESGNAADEGDEGGGGGGGGGGGTPRDGDGKPKPPRKRGNVVAGTSAKDQLARLGHLKNALFSYLFRSEPLRGEDGEKGVRVFAQDPSLLYGIRAIPSHSPEYLELLASWLEKLRALEEEEETKKKKHPQKQGGGAGGGASAGMSLTTRQSHIISGLLSACKLRQDGGPHSSNGGHGGPSSSDQTLPHPVDASFTASLSSYSYNPVVKHTPGDVLDALVPPRLLLFFDLSEKVIGNHLLDRQEQLLTIRRLTAELAALNSGNGGHDQGSEGGEQDGSGGVNYSSSSKVKLLERQLQAAYAAFLGCNDTNGQEGDGKAAIDINVMNPVVGEVLLMIETASPRQSTRKDLLTLEVELDHYLERSRARGTGEPLRSPGYYGYLQTLQPQSQPYGTAEPGAHSLAPHPPPPRPNKKGKGGTKALSPPTSTQQQQQQQHGGVAAAASVATAGSAAGDPAGAAAQLKKAGASPPASSSDCSKVMSGTTSVITALGSAHLELNRERTTLQFHLLKEELLRQVAIDLPERGVLLARLLDEAQLSFDAYDVLIRCACIAALQHKCLDGVEERHTEAMAKAAALEEELAALAARKAKLAERKGSLMVWVRERLAADEAARKQRTAFEEVVTERMRRHTEAVKAQQDRERRGSGAA